MHKVEISRKTIIFAVIFIIFLYFLWIVKDLILSLLIAFILMSALRPGVKVLEARGVPRRLGVIVVYFSFLLIFIYLFSIVIPPIVSETTSLVKSLPEILRGFLSPQVITWLQLESLTQYIPNVTREAFEIVSGIFSNIFFIVTTLVFGFYFLLEENIIRRFIMRFFEDKKTENIILVFENAEKRMSSWFWGEITLMFVVGLLTFIGLNLIGMKYALALAVLAGLLEVVPNLGPILSAIPAILIGLSVSYLTGIATLALYFIVQQLENTVIVPFVMKRAVGLDPIVTLIAIIVGGKIGGVLGVLLAIPIVLFVGTFLMEIRRNKGLFEDLF